mmetsp:Transcript_28459/g.39610  ORF Transcript_28459/g.39610 Transcript_28459/m.39610 type:complete len:201 (+) Transcript_28459:2265-2867(+)
MQGQTEFGSGLQKGMVLKIFESAASSFVELLRLSWTNVMNSLEQVENFAAGIRFQAFQTSNPAGTVELRDEFGYFRSNATNSICLLLRNHLFWVSAHNCRCFGEGARPHIVATKPRFSPIFFGHIHKHLCYTRIVLRDRYFRILWAIIRFAILFITTSWQLHQLHYAIALIVSPISHFKVVFSLSRSPLSSEHLSHLHSC